MIQNLLRVAFYRKLKIMVQNGFRRSSNAIYPSIYFSSFFKEVLQYRLSKLCCRTPPFDDRYRVVYRTWTVESLLTVTEPLLTKYLLVLPSASTTLTTPGCSTASTGTWFGRIPKLPLEPSQRSRQRPPTPRVHKRRT